MTRTSEQLAIAADTGSGTFRMTEAEIVQEFDGRVVFSADDAFYLAAHGQLLFRGRPVVLRRSAAARRHAAKVNRRAILAASFSRANA